MPQVPAGDLTGTYYIIVSSLPWQCSWQRLKDFARNLGDGKLIDIDHAMVFPGTTDGWVRVKGKENFLKVLGKGIVLYAAPPMLIFSSTSEWRYH